MSQFYSALETDLEGPTRLRYSVGYSAEELSTFIIDTDEEDPNFVGANLETLIRTTLKAMCKSKGERFLDVEAFSRDDRAIRLEIVERFGWDILNCRIVKIGPHLHFYGWAVVVDNRLSDRFESAGFEPSFHFHIEAIEHQNALDGELFAVIDPTLCEIDYSVAVSEPVDSVRWDMLNSDIEEHLCNIRD